MEGIRGFNQVGAPRPGAERFEADGLADWLPGLDGVGSGAGGFDDNLEAFLNPPSGWLHLDDGIDYDRGDDFFSPFFTPEAFAFPFGGVDYDGIQLDAALGPSEEFGLFFVAGADPFDGVADTADLADDDLVVGLVAGGLGLGAADGIDDAYLELPSLWAAADGDGVGDGVDEISAAAAVDDVAAFAPTEFPELRYEDLALGYVDGVDLADDVQGFALGFAPFAADGLETTDGVDGYNIPLLGLPEDAAFVDGVDFAPPA